MQVLGSLAGGGGLGGVTLGRAQVGDVLDQRGEPQYERYLGKVRVAGERRGGQEPGGPAQAVPGGSSARDAAVWMAGGAVIGVGGLAQHRAAQRRRGRVQRVGGGPGCIGGADPGPWPRGIGCVRRRRRLCGRRAPRSRSVPPT